MGLTYIDLSDLSKHVDEANLFLRFVSPDIYSIASAIFKRRICRLSEERTTIEGGTSAASHDIGARDAIEIVLMLSTHLCAMLRSATLVTKRGSERRGRDLVFHDYGNVLSDLSNAVDFTILARGIDAHLNIFASRPSFGDVASERQICTTCLLAREIRLKLFEVDRRSWRCSELR